MVGPRGSLLLDINIRCGFFIKSFSIVKFCFCSPISSLLTLEFLKIGGSLLSLGFQHQKFDCSVVFLRAEPLSVVVGMVNCFS